MPAQYDSNEVSAKPKAIEDPLASDGDAFKNGALSYAAQAAWSAGSALFHTAMIPVDGAYHAVKDTLTTHSNDGIDNGEPAVWNGVRGAVRAEAHEALAAAKDVGHVLGDGFEILGHLTDSVADVAKAGGNLLMAPVDAVGGFVKGTLETEAQGFKELGHGEIGSGLLHVVLPEYYGLARGIVGAAKGVGSAVVDLYHAAENII